MKDKSKREPIENILNEIIEYREQGLKYIAIADKYGYSSSYIRMIYNKWKKEAGNNEKE